MEKRTELAFKAYEIEEVADVYFFRPLGMVFARGARALSLTPTAVTVIGSAIGVAGGVLLADEHLGLLAFALIVLHSVLDSSDGQLARMTGQVSELGRVLDGVGGYVTHLAIYAAIVYGAAVRGEGTWAGLCAMAVVAGVCNIVHAQMYDYHRNAYVTYAIRGAVSRAETMPRALRLYEVVERRLAGKHADVEAFIRARTTNGQVSTRDRAWYRECFYWPVRGWNFLGDNTRFYAIGALAALHQIEWFFWFVLVPMNAALVALWMWQQRADRRFTARLW